MPYDQNVHLEAMVKSGIAEQFKLSGISLEPNEFQNLVKQNFENAVGRRFGTGIDSTVVQPEQQQTLLNMGGFNPEEYTPVPPLVAPGHPDASKNLPESAAF